MQSVAVVLALVAGVSGALAADGFWPSTVENRTPVEAEDTPRPALVPRHVRPIPLTLRHRVEQRRDRSDHDRDPVQAPHCERKIAIVGDQYASEAGAKAEAEKAWMQSVRFYFGERYMDIAFADEIAYACARSSVGSVVGQTFHRCEVSAKPCRALRQPR